MSRTPSPNRKPAANRSTKASGRTASSSSARTNKDPAAVEAIDKLIPVLEIDNDGIIITANEACARLLGFEAGELDGKGYRQIVAPEVANGTDFATFWNGLRQGQPAVKELRMLTRNGQELFCETNFQPVLDPASRVASIVAFLRDMTAQVKERDEMTKLRHAINGAQTPLIMVNRDFIVTYLNEQAVALLKKHEQAFRAAWPTFSADKVLGICIDTFHKNPAHQRNLLADPSRLPYRTDIQVGPLTFALCVSAQRDGQGNYIGNTLEWSDVTDIRRQEAINADFRGQMAAILSSQAFIEFQLDGTIVTANEIFQRALGYTLDEIKGKHHSLFVEPSYGASSDYRQFWNDLREGKPQSGQFKRIAKGGREIWIQAMYYPIADVTGKLCKVVKYASDITEMKRLEREAEEKAERDAKLAQETQAKVERVLEVVNNVADGNFEVHVPDLGNDAVGQVGQALRQAVTSMRTALSEVRSVAGTVATAASQLTSASQEISAGAQEQASSLEETASSLEEITSTVKQNTDNAQQARQLATGSRDIAEKGGKVVGDAVEAMSAINQASKKIADIITTIDEIAFQTNLLALNAAVEAARAGEQGRGFAVVAAEVRNLAQRSASAAKEIKTLIQDSVRKVENGTDLVNKSGQTLEEIVTSVKRVTDIVAEIAAASKEQLCGIEQVNKAVAQMDRVTQSNATQTEEMSGTATSLSSHAEQLQELVSRFRLGTDDNSTSSARTKPAATRPAPVRSTSTSASKRNGSLASRSLGSSASQVATLDPSSDGDASDEGGFLEF